MLGAPALALEPPPPALPRAAVGTIEYAFTPEDAADEMIVRAIDKARRQILVQTFSFTHRKIASALITARRRGVDVQIIADTGQTEKIRTSVIGDLAAGGVPVFLDDRHDSAHNKVMVVDAGAVDTALITGSYNFTHAAQFKNAENVLVIHGNPALSEAYRDNWKTPSQPCAPLPPCARQSAITHRNPPQKLSSCAVASARPSARQPKRHVRVL